MSDIELKRALVAGLYPGEGWKKKVQQMSDAQVIAIYLRADTSKQDNTPKNKESGDDGIPF